MSNNVAYYCSECTKELLEKFQYEYLPKITIESGDFVKLPFKQEIDGKEETEWMWVEVEFVKELQVMGILANEPVVIQNHHHSDTVIANISDIRNVIKSGTQKFVMDEEQEAQSLSHAH